MTAYGELPQRLFAAPDLFAELLLTGPKALVALAYCDACFALGIAPATTDIQAFAIEAGEFVPSPDYFAIEFPALSAGGEPDDFARPFPEFAVVVIPTGTQSPEYYVVGKADRGIDTIRRVWSLLRARLTLARMSEAVAVQTKGVGLAL